jgi:Cys-rich protein (TIGR01571 family)
MQNPIHNQQQFVQTSQPGHPQSPQGGPQLSYNNVNEPYGSGGPGVYNPGNHNTLNVHPDWSTTLCDCIKDEESCWWSSWCGCLVSGRNAQSFEVGNASTQSWGVLIFALTVVVLFFIIPLLALPILFAGLIYYAYFKAEIRGRIRQKYQIPGTLCSDCLLHAFCPCCAVAQEARESIHRRTKLLDFWYGEELSKISFPQFGPRGENFNNPAENGNDNLNSPILGDASEGGTNHDLDDGSGSLLTRLKTVSLFSKFLLNAWAALFAFVFAFELARGQGRSVLVLLLVFVQPVLIMYFVYWADANRRKHVSLDYVIKMFTVGFFMATSQAIVFESIFELILMVFVGIVIFIIDPSSRHNDDDDNNNSSSSNNSLRAQLTSSLRQLFQQTHHTSWKNVFANAHGGIAILTGGGSEHAHMAAVPFESDSLSMSMDYAAFANPLLSSNLGGSAASRLHLFSDGNNGDSSSSNDDADDATTGGMDHKTMQRNFFVVVFAMLVMAFVIAAGVEETTKHFAVRCCRFPAALRDPHAVLIYLMTAAIGFATSENIEYVFGTKR